jgi:hypothetical protein
MGGHQQYQKVLPGPAPGSANDLIFRNCEFNVYRDVNFSGGEMMGWKSTTPRWRVRFFSFRSRVYRGQHQDFIQTHYGAVTVKNAISGLVQYGIYFSSIDGGRVSRSAACS